jgi:type IV secretion system protein VirD4
MIVVRHYSALWVIGLAAGTQNELLRYFLLRSSILVGTASPLQLVVTAYAFNPNRFLFVLAAGLAAFSAELTGAYEYARLADYYPRYLPFYLLGCIDLFAVAGAVATAAVPVKIGSFYFSRYRPRTVRRAASALHGENDWILIRTAASWFVSGGMVVGEAYRPDLQPRLGGKAPLLRYDGESRSSHMLVFAGSGGSKTTATVVPSALEWRSGLVCLGLCAGSFPARLRGAADLGHRVVTLNPESRYSEGFNALDWIDPSSDRALLAISRRSWRGCAERRRANATRTISVTQAALCSPVPWSTNCSRPTSNPSIRRSPCSAARLRCRCRNSGDIWKRSTSRATNFGFGFPSQLAGNLKDITGKQFAGFCGEAGNATLWLAIPSLARLACGNSFGTEQLLSGKLDVFINVPLKALESTPQVCAGRPRRVAEQAYTKRGGASAGGCCCCSMKWRGWAT